MGFFNICPRNQKFLEYSLSDIPLKVIQEEIDFSPDFSVQQTDLNNGYKHFKVNTGRADSFKVTVIIHKNEKVDAVIPVTDFNAVNMVSNPVQSSEFGTQNLIGDVHRTFTVRFLLNYFMRHLTPLMINSDIIEVNKNQLWVITENKSRKQEYTDYVEWELEFTQYVPIKYATFTKTTKTVQNAIKKAKSTKAKKVSATTSVKQKLAKCNPTLLRYSKTKKVTACIKVLQTVLYNEGCIEKTQIDGWYGNVTKQAVYKYQTKYKTKYGLKPNGFINTATFNALIGKGKVVKTNKVTVKNKKTTTKKPQQIGATRIIK